MRTASRADDRHPPHRSIRRTRRGPDIPGTLLLAALIGSSLSPSALGRAQQNRTLDGLIARCTTVNTSTLPKASLERYGVSADEDAGLLSCVVQEQMPGLEVRNVPARMTAEYHSIGQAPEPIEMREVREGNLVTYVGTYAVSGGDPLVFDVSLEVDGAGTLEMTFDDRTPQL